MALYGDEDYYPGDNDKSTDDFYTYGGQPDDRAIDMLARRAKVMGRNDHFAAGAATTRLEGSPSALSLSQKEASDRRAGDAANLAADNQVHGQAHEQATAAKPKTQAQRRQDQKGRNFRPEDRQGTEYAERAARAKARDKK
jgi:hypothetical protein